VSTGTAANPTLATSTYSSATNISAGANLVLGADTTTQYGVVRARRDLTAFHNGLPATNPQIIIDSSNSLHLVYVSKEYNTTYTNIAHRTSADGGTTWSERADVTTSTTRNSSNPQIASSSPNTFHVAYTSNEFNASYTNVAYRKSTDGGLTWSGRVDVTTSTVSLGSSEITVDSANNLHVVYYSQEFNASFYNIAYRKSTDSGATWSGRVDVTTSTSQTSLVPQLIRDSADNLHVVYASYEYNGSNYNIAYRKSTDGGATWSGRANVTAGSANSGAPDIAIDSSNNLHVVYQSYEYNASNYNIAYRSSTDGGATWSERVNVTTAGAYGGVADPKIAVDSSGNLHVVYWFYDQLSSPYVYYRTSINNGATWSTRLDLSYIVAEYPVIAVGASNNLFVAYISDEFNTVASGNYNIIAQKSTNGGSTWSTRAALPGLNNQSYNPKIVVNTSTGMLYMAYYSNEYANSYNNIALRTSSDGGATWGVRRDVTANTTVSSINPVIAISSNGNLNVAYQSKEYNATYYNIAARTSTDGGLTWGARRDVTTSGGVDNIFPSPTFDSSGNSLIVYLSKEYNGVYNVALRTSTNGGLTWGTRRDVTQSSANMQSAAPAISIQPTGIIYVAYNSQELNGYANVALRTSTDSGLTWGTRRDLTT
ncbi:MAG: sialidase family protein, partial [Patescibacteria group bacterium]